MYEEEKSMKTYLVEDVHCTLNSWRKKMNKTSRKMMRSGEPDKNPHAASTMEEKIEKMNNVQIGYPFVSPPTSPLL